MKKLYLLFLGVILLASCKKSEENLSNEKLIVGTWQSVSSISKIYKNNVLITSETDQNSNEILVFNADLSFKDRDIDPTNPGVMNWTYGTYSISGETLTTIWAQQDTYVYTIKNITKSSLTLVETYTYRSGGFDYKEIYEYVWKKV